MKENLASRRRSIPLALAVSTVAMMSCQAVQERSALAQVADGRDGRASTAETAGEGLPEVSVRRVWAGDQIDFYQMAMSPVGRYFSMIDWSTGNLAVHDLRTEQMHRLTAQGRGGPSFQEAGPSTFSRDGRRLAYAWQQPGWIQLRLIDFDPDSAGVPQAADPPVSFDMPQFAPYDLFDWSPDGRTILALGYSTSPQLVLISATDGTRRALKSFDWREPLLAEFSPDGRYIAYDFPPDVDSPNRDVFVLSVDGTRDTRIVGGPATDRLLGWHPDGSILFHSTRGRTPSVFRLPMADGQPAGPPQLVKEDMWQVEPIGIAGSDLYYGVDVNPQRFYTAPIDLETGRLLGPPIAIGDPTRIQIRAWDWSPDGRLLAYAGSTGGLRADLFGRGPTMVVIRSDGREDGPPIYLDLGRPSRLRWAPDGNSLIIWAKDAKGRRGFHRIDLETGTYSTILRGEALGDAPRNGYFDISPDGQTLWFARRDVHESTVRMTLVAYDLETGTSRTVAPIDSTDGGLVSVSPDGTLLAVVAPGSPRGVISTIPVEGGAATPLFPIPENTTVWQLEWTRNGTRIVFNTRQLGSSPWGPWKTWVVPADGGDARPLQLGEHVSAREMSLRPDGGRIGFLAGESRGEVWVMEGLGAARAETTTGSAR